METLAEFSEEPATLWSPLGAYRFKYCSRCGNKKSIADFYPNRFHLTGYTNECRDCNAAMHRVYRQRPGGKERAKKVDALRRYRLTEERYDELMAQGCAICSSTRRLSIDHDHACCEGDTSCGQCVRGVLCGTCNLGIGALQDNPDLLRKAIDYLMK